MGLDKGQISRTIKRLEKKELVQTDKSTADNRLRKISLTQAGIDHVDKMFPIMMKRQAHLQAGFAEEELEQLFDYLHRLEDKSGALNIEGLSGVKMSKNLIVILSDEHQARALGCAGHAFVQTPHLDKLAASGMRFTNAYTRPLSVCRRGRPLPAVDIIGSLG